jgi:hypothetical protein
MDRGSRTRRVAFSSLLLHCRGNRTGHVVGRINQASLKGRGPRIKFLEPEPFSPNIPIRHEIQKPEALNLDTNLPYLRFKTALTTGILRAIRTDGKRATPVRSDFWTDSLDKFLLPPSVDPLDLPKDQYVFQRDNVIAAEAIVGGGPYHQNDWAFCDALGWIGYQNESLFRQLNRNDLGRERIYWNQRYETGLLCRRPQEELHKAITGGKLKARRNGGSVSLVFAHKTRSVWEFGDCRFSRDDLLRLWPPRSSNIAQNGAYIVPAGKIEAPRPTPKLSREMRGRGRIAKERPRVAREMVQQIEAGSMTTSGLSDATQQGLATRFGVSRDTIIPARTQALVAWEMVRRVRTGDMTIAQLETAAPTTLEKQGWIDREVSPAILKLARELALEVLSRP